jgi:hypothetical protein
MGYGDPHSQRYMGKAKPRGPDQQAKFLEKPAREKSRPIAGIVRTAWQQGRTLVQGLLLGGLFLQRESQKIVPVDTGNLKASAFTRIDP